MLDEFVLETVLLSVVMVKRKSLGVDLVISDSVGTCDVSGLMEGT